MAVVVLAGCGDTKFEATSVYTVPEVPANEGNQVIYETMMAGTYVIGKSPSEYVTGNEKEFTTGTHETYIAGEDFPVGTYDLVAVSGPVLAGEGDVHTSGNSYNAHGLSIEMGVGDNRYIKTYDNYTFEDGEELKVNGTSIKLVPQTNDTFVIEPGKYDLMAIEGYGYVQFSNAENLVLNEQLMGIAGDSKELYSNCVFIEGDILTVSEVSLVILGEPPHTAPIPAYEVTETATYDTKAEGQTATCTTDVSGVVELVDCTELRTYNLLKADLESQLYE